MLRELPEKIRIGKATVSVIGLGRVGLPLAVILARSGLRVKGVDVDERRVSLIRRGQTPFYYPIVQDWLKDVLSAKAFTATATSNGSIDSSDVIVVSVGTPTGTFFQTDYSQFHSGLREVAKTDLRNKGVIIRSTIAPGTLDTIVLPLLTSKSGLQPGVDFAIAVCPERITEGQAHRELYELPEIIGALDETSVAVASELFRRISPAKKMIVTSPTGAELAKLFSNIYRYVNFALANEFAVWAEFYGEDAQKIISAANQDYPRCNIPRPGFAGGPCLGKDGLLLDNGTSFSSIVSVAWKLNEAIPQHVVNSLMQEIGPLYGKKISVLGLAFKADSDDLRLSPSAKLVEILKSYGAEVSVHDPYVMGTASLEDVLDQPEAVILATNHSNFRDLASAIDNSRCKYIYDVWGLYSPSDFKRAIYRRLGKARPASAGRAVETIRP